MTLLEEIIAGGFDLENRDDGAIASALSLNRTKQVSRFVTARTVLAECPDGSTILDKLEAAGQQISAVKWAMVFLLQDGGLDIGHPRTLGMVDQLALGQILTQSESDQLHALSIVEDVITPQDVAKALEGYGE